MLYTPNPERLVRVQVQADTERLHRRIAELEQELKAQRALVQMYRHVAFALSEALSRATKGTARAYYGRH